MQREKTRTCAAWAANAVDDQLLGAALADYFVVSSFLPQLNVREFVRGYLTMEDALAGSRSVERFARAQEKAIA